MRPCRYPLHTATLPLPLHELMSARSSIMKDPVHKKIMHTKDELVENDDFDPGEAMEVAVDKKKFLIRRLLKGYKFDEENVMMKRMMMIKFD